MLQNAVHCTAGQHTILKEDHFSRMRSQRCAQHLPGAPNFRGVACLPVYGVAIPTVEGARAVLRHVLDAAAAAAGAGESRNVPCCATCNSCLLIAPPQVMIELVLLNLCCGKRDKAT